ncbi:hypothetical protein ACIX9V_000032 [Vibrio vulnificus]
MKIEIRDLHKNHPVVLAARVMAEAHHNHETMAPACSMVSDLFPELTPDQVMCLWLGVNAGVQNGALEE